MSFKEYSNWYVKSIKCNFCKEYASGNDRGGFICNNNIDKSKVGGNYPVRPQAGYVDIKWFNQRSKNDFRILLLGMNPRDGYKPDDELYKIYDQIKLSGFISKEQMKNLSKQIQDFSILTHIKPKLEEILRKYEKDLIFTYANQVLCRSDPEGSDLAKNSEFKKVYENCFKQNILELIKITKPELVIFCGKTWKSCFNNIKDKYLYDTPCFLIHHPANANHIAARKILDEEVPKYIAKELL